MSVSRRCVGRLLLSVSSPVEVRARKGGCGAGACYASKGIMTQVLFKTNMGDLVLELDDTKAPKTVKNFLSYVNSGHYAGTLFHRVIDNFMIQGGGFDKDMREKPAPNRVENEARNGLKNVRYSVAMARTSDPQSASAQFFINVKDNTFLDYPGQDGFGYAVFGKVVKGSDVVDKIEKVKTGAQDVPVQQVVIGSATLIK
jgi:cyclophilin family peptidyl-prolyl cis-trans isomerase